MIVWGIPSKLLIGIKYLNSEDWVQYNYNQLDQLTSVSMVPSALSEKFKIVKEIQYDPAGNLTQMTYRNGVTTTITPDVVSRPEQIQVKDSKGNKLLNLNYAYDANSSVINRNNNVNIYDILDRLETAEIDGTILVDRPALKGYAAGDYFTNLNLDYQVQDMVIDFDFAASSIGLKFATLQQIGHIELIPEIVGENQLGKESIQIYYRQFTGRSFIELSSVD